MKITFFHSWNCIHNFRFFQSHFQILVAAMITGDLHVKNFGHCWAFSRWTLLLSICLLFVHKSRLKLPTPIKIINFHISYLSRDHPSFFCTTCILELDSKTFDHLHLFQPMKSSFYLSFSWSAVLWLIAKRVDGLNVVRQFLRKELKWSLPV